MDWKERLLARVDEMDWLDTLSESVQPAVHKVFDSMGTAGGRVMDFLHGVWLGHPLHPVLTDAAVGSYTAALALDALEMATGDRGIGDGADAAIAVGAASAVGAAVTGITDWHHTMGRARRLGAAHALLNTTSLAFYLTSLVLRRQRNRGAGWALGLLGFGAMTAAAYLGGHLVYSEKVGVDRAPHEGSPKKFTPVMAAQDLQEDTLHRVDVENIPVLLVRRGNSIYAIAETCSHLGGPLADGELNEDNTVVCPWHGSRFSIEDGSLVNGPSVYNQPCFEARVRSGQIEIRSVEHIL